MFSGFNTGQKEIFFNSDDSSDLTTEDAHYEEHEESFSLLEDGIGLDETMIDEYEEFDDEMEADIPEPQVSEDVIKNDFIDEIEAEHYDSLEDE